MATLGGDLKKVPSALSASGVSVAGHEIGYPHGHLGHLNDEEEAALGEFKALLEERGLYKPGPPASSDDQTLLWVSPLLLRGCGGMRLILGADGSSARADGSPRTRTSSSRTRRTGARRMISMCCMTRLRWRRTRRVGGCIRSGRDGGIRGSSSPHLNTQNNMN